MNLILALKHSIFLPCTCLMMFIVCILVSKFSGRGGFAQGWWQDGAPAAPYTSILPLCPSLVLSCCLAWRETHKSFMLPVYHPSHHLVLPLSLAAAVGRLRESAYSDTRSISPFFCCVIWVTDYCSFSANYLQHLAKVENIARVYL